MFRSESKKHPALSTEEFIVAEGGSRHIGVPSLK